MDDCEAPFTDRDEVTNLRGIIVEQDEIESPESYLQVIPPTGAWIGTVGLDQAEDGRLRPRGGFREKVFALFTLGVAKFGNGNGAF
jgi:hypothetical protein